MWTNKHSGVTGIVLACMAVALLTPRAQALPPDPDNAALLYYQAFLIMADVEDETRKLITDVAKGDAAPDDKVRQAVIDCRGAIALAEVAGALPECDWGFQFSKGFEALMPQLAPSRYLTYILVADARVRAADGDIRGALERCLMTDTLARHVGDDTLICYLVSVAVRAMGYRCMEDLVGQTDDVQLLEWLQGELATSSEGAVSVLRPLKMEAEIAADLLQGKNVEKLVDLFGEADPETRKRIAAAATEEVLRKARRLYLDRVTKSQEILAGSMPYEQAVTQLNALSQVDDPNDPTTVGVTLLMPAISRVYSLKTRSQAHANAMKIAVALCLAKAKSGRLPRTLPADAPKDPFSGKPFQYERTDEGFTLRCSMKELGTDRTHEYTFKVK